MIGERPGLDFSDYCRQLEAYLRNKNEGHLIRIVGPAFEQVCGWAAQGVPLKIAFRGIDRYCERYYAKGVRRRPVRIEFCEADILEVFDQWRRALGVSGSTPEDERAPRRPSLASHIDRAVARLTARRGGGDPVSRLDLILDTIVRELERLAANARHARGRERASIIDRLGQLDVELVTTGVGALDPATAGALQREAATELAPFASRMAPDERTRALQAAFHRLVGESLGLPTLRYD